MKRVTKSFLSVAMGLLFAGAMWAMPAMQAHHAAMAQAQDQAKSLSASGKITSVTGSTFVVEVTKPDGSVDPITFTTDQTSSIDGKLVEGATADVTYKTDDGGKNLVVSVHVTPPPKTHS